MRWSTPYCSNMCLSIKSCTKAVVAKDPLRSSSFPELSKTQDSERIVVTMLPDSISFKFEDGSEAPRNVVFNTKLLCDMLSEVSDGEGITVSLNGSMLRSWFSYVSHNAPFRVAALHVRLTCTEKRDDVCVKATVMFSLFQAPATRSMLLACSVGWARMLHRFRSMSKLPASGNIDVQT